MNDSAEGHYCYKGWMNFTRKPWGNEERGRSRRWPPTFITVRHYYRLKSDRWTLARRGQRVKILAKIKKKKKKKTFDNSIRDMVEGSEESGGWKSCELSFLSPPPFLSSFYEIPVISSSRISWLDWPAAASAFRNPIFQRREAEPWIYGTSHAYIDAAA